ncbi:MAG: hypothetical protein R3F43_03630 [bacterium]
MPDPTKTAPRAALAPAADAFSCAEAPRLLGLSAYSVQVCREVPHLKGFYKVTLTHLTEGTVARPRPDAPTGRSRRLGVPPPPPPGCGSRAAWTTPAWRWCTS